jgi:hypothetical protein
MAATATGRLSSVDPNLQNIPTTGEGQVSECEYVRGFALGGYALHFSAFRIFERERGEGGRVRVCVRAHVCMTKTHRERPYANAVSKP